MIVAILQARMGSSRLPEKVALNICGHPMLWHQLQRIKLAKRLDQTVVATTSRPEDSAISDIAKAAGVPCVRGSVDDVLDRYYQAAKGAGATTIVRLTGDCPLADPLVIDQAVDCFLERRGELDYVSLSPEWPEGFDTEVFSFETLERAWNEAEKPSEREHVTSYLTLSGKFRLHQIPSPRDLSMLRLTVDEPVDHQVVSGIFEELYPRHGHAFGLPEIMDLYEGKPDIFRPNMEVPRNEGLLKSMRAERKPLRFDPKPVVEQSEATWERAKSLIPAGTQTLSKGPTQYVQGIAPKYLRKGQGCRVWDVDGNEYIDYPMGLGSVILGHNYPRVNQAIQSQMSDGISFSLMHPLEVELAELLTSVIPWAEMARFGKNGSDATTGAVRAARAITGRETILHCGYHGWHDWYVAGTSRNKGVPSSAIGLQAGFPYNDLAAVEALFEEHKGKVAAVIMEPSGVNLPEAGFLEGVKRAAHANGALLIFDEILTGFRFCLGGSQAMFGVAPDMACFGKAMGNGMPISTIVGTKETMAIFDEVFYSFTFGGECLSLAASIATINEMKERNVISHLWEMGTRLKDGYQQLIWDLKLGNYSRCVGSAPLTSLVFLDQGGNDSLLLKSLFQQEILKRGVLFGALHCVSYSHTAGDIDHTLAAYDEALGVVKKAIESGDAESFAESLLEGSPVQPVFRPRH